MTRKKEAPAPDWVEDAFTLGPLIMCRLRGNRASQTDAVMADMVRSPESSDEVHIGLQIDGIAQLQKLYVHLGDFLARMESGEVH